MNARDVIARLFPANKVWSIRPYVAADMVLTALRDAGFEVYRPDECIEARLTSLSLNLNQPQRVGFEVVSVHQVPTPPTLSPDGDAPTYRLVPVESPKENE